MRDPVINKQIGVFNSKYEGFELENDKFEIIKKE